ncbi:TorF family putative porin, partial [Acinetobacter baumannii]|uniref:TorF family putative porin n=1 Tax=Acinetobacter baumannii TaxID=470 RepID=UPI003390BCC1
KETGSSSGLSLSGSAALTTDYRFRGLSQSRNDPAIQGTFVLSHDSGLYAGIFAANTDFGGSTSPHFEFTSNIGYKTTLNWSQQVKPTLDLSYNRFSYPGWSDWAWHEFSARLTFDNVFWVKDSLLTNINY